MKGEPMETQTMQHNENNSITAREKRLLTVFSVLVILVSISVAWFFISNKPKARRARPTEPAPAVSVMRLTARDHQVVLHSMGTVTADLEIDLVAESSGVVIDIHPEFLPGGRIRKGDVLARVEDIPYRAAVAQAELALEQALLELRQEEGRQIIAEKEWKLMGAGKATDLEKELALRKLHLQRAQAQVKAAETALQKAQLDLEKTRIRAPFNAIVRSTGINIGEFATPQKILATIVGTDTYRVLATIPVDRVPWLEFPSAGNPSEGRVLVYDTHGGRYAGTVTTLLSDIEPGGKLARVLVHVPDPLGQEYTATDWMPLLLDQYVRLDILGKTETNVYRIARDYLHENDMIHLLSDENTLLVQPVDIIWRDRDIVLVRGDLENKRLIVTDLPGPVHGMPLTLQKEVPSGIETVTETVSGTPAEIKTGEQ
jgi:RND family efflux transporter MFP subunit